jgi:hypothetical protein
LLTLARLAEPCLRQRVSTLDLGHARPFLLGNADVQTDVLVEQVEHLLRCAAVHGPVPLCPVHRLELGEQAVPAHAA